MTRLRLTLCVTMLLVVPATAAAQSSQFGIRGLGVPGRGLSSRATAMGGAIGLFDPASVQAMAPVTQLDGLALGLETLQEWRSTENPGGSGEIRNNRFPQFRIGGPIRRVRTWLAASSSTYTNNDFGVATTDTIMVRGEPLGVVDTLVGLGGLNDLRLGAGYALNSRWSVGGAVHIITGSTRNRIRREFADPQYQSFRDSTEISFEGVGFSLSVLGRLSRTIAVAAMVRSDGKANIMVDSTGAGSVDLPYTVAAGIRWQPSALFIIATEGVYQTWSAINSDLLERGGVGAENSYSVALGAEWGLRGSMTALPLRAGVRYGRMPFPLEPGSQPWEAGVSIGTGFRFARQKASVDLSAEYVRRQQTEDWTETSFLLTVGVELRP